MTIGIDPHKSSRTASAVDRVTNTVVALLRIDASLAGYGALLKRGRQFADNRWAIGNAKGLGYHLGQWLVARREPVFGVATTATARCENSHEVGNTTTPSGLSCRSTWRSRHPAAPTTRHSVRRVVKGRRVTHTEVVLLAGPSSAAIAYKA